MAVGYCGGCSLAIAQFTKAECHFLPTRILHECSCQYMSVIGVDCLPCRFEQVLPASPDAYHVCMLSLLLQWCCLVMLSICVLTVCVAVAHVYAAVACTYAAVAHACAAVWPIGQCIGHSRHTWQHHRCLSGLVPRDSCSFSCSTCGGSSEPCICTALFQMFKIEHSQAWANSLQPNFQARLIVG